MLNSTSNIIRCRIPMYTKVLRCSTEAVEGLTFQERKELEYKLAKPFDTIPGPRRLPLIGNLHLFSKFGPYSFDKLYDAYEDLYKKYGPIIRLDIGMSMVALFDPDAIGTVFKNDRRFPARPLLEALRHHRLKHKDKYGSAGMVAANGEEWEKIRKAAQFMIALSFPKKYFAAQEEIASDFAGRIFRVRDSGGRVNDFLRELYRFTEESIGIVCFGLRLGLLDESKSDTTLSSKITKASEDTLQSFADTFVGFPWWKFFNTPSYKRLVESQEFFHDFALECIEKAKEKLKDPSSSSDPTLEFYRTLSEKKNIDHRDIALVMTEIFSAGIDATGNTIGFTLYNLATNPHTQDALYKEIQLHAPPDEPLTLDKIDKMRYLRACLSESYRLTPTAGGMARILHRPAVVSGYQIPKDVLCVGLNPVLCRQPQYFSDPLQFKPERWLEQGGANFNSFCVLPYSHGRRACVGQQVAKQEINLCIIKIIQKYRVKYEGPEIGRKMRLLLIPDKPLNFIFEDRVKP